MTEYILIRTSDPALARAVQQVVVASNDAEATMIPATEGRTPLWGEVAGQGPLYETVHELFTAHLEQSKKRSRAHRAQKEQSKVDTLVEHKEKRTALAAVIKQAREEYYEGRTSWRMSHDVFVAEKVLASMEPKRDEVPVQVPHTQSGTVDAERLAVLRRLQKLNPQGVGIGQSAYSTDALKAVCDVLEGRLEHEDVNRAYQKGREDGSRMEATVASEAYQGVTRAQVEAIAGELTSKYASSMRLANERYLIGLFASRVQALLPPEKRPGVQ